MLRACSSVVELCQVCTGSGFNSHHRYKKKKDCKRDRTVDPQRDPNSVQWKVQCYERTHMSNWGQPWPHILIIWGTYKKLDAWAPSLPPTVEPLGFGHRKKRAEWVSMGREGPLAVCSHCETNASCPGGKEISKWPRSHPCHTFPSWEELQEGTRHIGNK